ncbi:unnamed protein product [Phytomonas sp. EM1]|nr:unnamed protein product [Phytomonas sp. EM1]|eukprot:CCW62171.1 unnamed protein product [Phytomonas sp. isolate EM1]
MDFLNTLDCLSATLMPMAPEVFERTFLEVLSLLADGLGWCVRDAVRQRRCIPSSTDVEARPPRRLDHGIVFDEDLDCVRFAVRVVATHTHRYLPHLHALLGAPPSVEVGGLPCRSRGGLEVLCTRLLRPVFLMLSSLLFPKDVLNAGGLLLASMVTVTACDPAHLHRICRLVCTEVVEDAIPSLGVWTLPQGVFALVYPPNPHGGVLSRSEDDARALRRLFGSLTKNGRFAFLKGLLAHLSKPIYGYPGTIGILLRPLSAPPASSPGGDENREGKPTLQKEEEEVPAYDLIVPFAERFGSAIQEPETRFMAIQTLDSVVRHAAASFSFMRRWLRAPRGEPSTDRNSTSNPEVSIAEERCRARKKERREVDAAAATKKNSLAAPEGLTPEAAARVGDLFRACSLFAGKLERTLDAVTQLIMGLWDDGTQSMSGALYETYDQVLLARQQFRSVRTIFHPTEGGEAAEEEVTDSLETLLQVLAIQSERRAKYHALLGLFSVMPLRGILEALDRFYVKTTTAASASWAVETPSSLAYRSALTSFAESLLSGASNHKVGNVSGDVFVKLARLLNSPVVQPTQANAHAGLVGWNLPELFHHGLLAPLSRAIAMEGYVRVVANVQASTNISNLIAHFVVPLLKQVDGAFPRLLSCVLGLQTAPGASRARVYQGVVEVLYRARDAGLDLAAFTAPTGETAPILRASLQAGSFELRNTALRLCVLPSKRGEPVEGWQCHLVEAFLSLNLHLGGDTTARKGLLDSFRKWAAYVAESLKRGPHRPHPPSRGNPPVEGGESHAAAAYTQRLVDHSIACVRLFAEHYGQTVEQSHGLSIERRTAAASGLDILLTELTSVIRGEAAPSWWRVRLREFFPGGIVRSLLADLSDGWSLARKCAKKVLLFYFQHAFPVVREGVDPESVLKAAISELRGALTYRSAEGAVERFMLFDTQTPEAHQEAASDPEKVLLERLERLSAEVAALASMCREIQALRGNGMGVEACAFVRQHPLHGRLSLCMAMLSSAASLCRGSSNPQKPRTAASSNLKEASNEFLRCSSEVLRTCSTLVGSEPLVWSALNRNESKDGGSSANLAEATTPSVVVDCRGHVYDPNERPEAEGLMRIVVNNTWLAIRNATLAVHLITVKLHGLTELDFDVVRTVGFDLINTLLSTKHNGVMRCVQDALRGLSEVLLRCREPLFYSLPSEMANYLMGEVGVMSSDSSRMLRRSQGLPHAILSILDAEDSSLPCFIFPSVMSRLLALVREAPLSEGDQPEAVKTPTEVQLSRRSNSLNVLKFIFDDKILAERAIPYLEEVFLLATEGFSDPNWGIRNSSLMLFSSVLQRFVGEHPSTGGVGVNTSLHDITRRTPRAVSFALRVLSQSSTSPSIPGSVFPSNTSNLSIFPVLQMLSMLSPDPANLLRDPRTDSYASQEGEKAGAPAAIAGEPPDHTDLLVEAVMRCGADRCLAARTASARALVCVVPCSDVPTTLRRLATRHLRSRGGTTNGIHGCLVQLHQFHIHYVGTLTRPQRHDRLSSRATPTLAAAVAQGLGEILLRHGDVLGRACLACPAIAAAGLELVNDLVYFGPPNGLSREPLMRLLAWAMSILERNLFAASSAFARAKAYHGGVREAGALCLLLAARFLHLHPSDQGGDESEARIRSCIQRVWAQGVGTLDLAYGSYNIISRFLNHVHIYTTERRLFPKEELMGLVTEGLRTAYNIDLPSVSLRALTKALTQHCSDHTLGCVAWEEVMAHLEFAVSMLLRGTPLETSELLDADYQIIQECVLPLLDSSNTSHSKHETWLHPPEFCGVALRFVVRRSLQKASALPERITKILSAYAWAENPLIVRKAVLEALSDCFEVISARQERPQPTEGKGLAAVAKPRMEASQAMGPLLLILVRLLCDDAAEVRDDACRVCPLVLRVCAAPDVVNLEASSDFLVQDQTSSLLSIVLVLRQLVREKRVSLHEVETFLTSNDSLPLPLLEAPYEAATLVDGLGPIEAEDDEIGDDILFQKEPDNMFMEKVTLEYIVDTIKSALHSHVIPMHGERVGYGPYNELLSSAESAKSLRVRIIDSLGQ